MPEVNENVEATEAAPKAKSQASKVKKATKPVAKVAKKAVKGKPAKAAPKKERAERVASEEISNKILKHLSKQTKPTTRNKLCEVVGREGGVRTACRAMRDAGLLKQEAAKFHDLGRGVVYTITANGKKTAAKL